MALQLVMKPNPKMPVANEQTCWSCLASGYHPLIHWAYPTQRRHQLVSPTSEVTASLAVLSDSWVRDCPNPFESAACTDPRLKPCHGFSGNIGRSFGSQVLAEPEAQSQTSSTTSCMEYAVEQKQEDQVIGTRALVDVQAQEHEYSLNPG